MTAAGARDGEVEDLRARLNEAEETLRAIRQGEVDALMVSGSEGERVFTLKNADQPYRIMMERMREGALTLSAEGGVLYGNHRLADMVGLPLERVLGRSFFEFVESQEERSELARLLAGGGEVRRELWLRRPGATGLRALLSVSPVALDDVRAVSGILADLTEQRRGEEAAAAARFALAVVEQASEPMVVCDLDGRVLRASRAALSLAGAAPESRLFWEAFPVRTVGAGQSGALEALLGEAVRGRTVQDVEAVAGHGAGQRHFQLSAGPLWSAQHESIGCVVTLTDITRLKRAEEHQGILLAELSHRVKNTLAIVRAIAERTASGAADPDAFNRAFQGRLSALALAHDVLTRVGWGQADLRQLLGDSLSAASGRGVELDGPEVTLPPQFVLPFTLIFHELATNALKYGALSGEAGKLSIVWWRAADDELRIEWRERAERRVAKPRRRGFGSQLIARTASFDLDGEAELDYRPEGLVCRLRIPLRASEAALLQEAVSTSAGT